MKKNKIEILILQAKQNLEVKIVSILILKVGQIWRLEAN